MSGLAALLDDIAALVKLAAASVDDVAAAAGRASAKAAGVVVDDTAVAPQFVRGVDPSRELPIIWRITRGSLINKLVIIVPIALLLSQFAPWALTPLLMIGGTYLCFEGAEKVWHMLRPGHDDTEPEAPVAEAGPDAEKRVVRGAIRTDFILSAEIMVISLNEVVASDPTGNLWLRAATLVVVAILITLAVYGVVGVIVKMDDFGLHLAGRRRASTRRIGLAIVKGMPGFLNVISFVGMLAMLWVGGHIILVGTHELGLAQPYEFVHHVEGLIEPLAVAGPALAWCFNTLCSLVLGFIVGSIVMGVIHLLPFGKTTHDAGAEAHAGADAGPGSVQVSEPVDAPGDDGTAGPSDVPARGRDAERGSHAPASRTEAGGVADDDAPGVTPSR